LHFTKDNLSPSLDQSAKKWWSFGAPPFNHGKISAERITNDVLQWIDSHRDNPFYLYVHYMDVHSPYDGKWYPLFNSKIYPTQSRKEKIVNIYNGRIVYVDRQINRIWEYLNQTNLSKNTLLIITADHGEEFFDHERRGHNHTLYDELIRIPLIMSCNSFSEIGRIVKKQVQLLDLPITVLNFLNIEAPEHMKGQPLIPLRVDSSHLSDRTFALSYTSKGLINPKFAKGQSLLFKDYSKSKVILESLRVNNEWKIIMGSDGRVELYNIAGDEKEKNNLNELNHPMIDTLRNNLLEYTSQLNRFDSKKEEHILSPDARNRLKALGYLK